MPTAFVLIKCEDGPEHKMVRSFDKTDVTMDVQPTVGHYDLVAKIRSSNLEDLNEIIEEIHGNEKVRATKVLLETTETALTA
jgi:DNA-binding Lrp family transcriptional regulator